MPSTSQSIPGQFSPSLIRPHPKAGPRKESGKGRRKRHSEILTDTPVKLQLEEEDWQKREKRQRGGGAKGKQRKAKKMFCGTLHSRSAQFYLSPLPF